MSEAHAKNNARLLELARVEAKQMAECLLDDGWGVVFSPDGDRIVYQKPHAKVFFIADFTAVDAVDRKGKKK